MRRMKTRFYPGLSSSSARSPCLVLAGGKLQRLFRRKTPQQFVRLRQKLRHGDGHPGARSSSAVPGGGCLPRYSNTPAKLPRDPTLLTTASI
ncbi:hypothetical protein AOLI_G00301810 [Acnodon oligacanthus]